MKADAILITEIQPEVYDVRVCGFDSLDVIIYHNIIKPLLLDAIKKILEEK